MYELMIEESFAAAHQLKGYRGPCENIHGHTFKVQVFIKGNQLNPVGYVVDFKELKSVVKNEIDKLDHRFLNEIMDENPTCENIARHLFDVLASKMTASVSQVTVWESPSACASYRVD